MDRNTLISMMRSYLDRPELSTDDAGMMIKMVEGELNRYLAEHPRNQRRTTYTATALNPILPLPVDLMRTVRLYTDTASYAQYPPDARDAAAESDAAYIARGTCLELFPTPAEDTVFHLDYIAAIKPLELELDTNWVLDYFTDLYLYGCLKEASVWFRDDARLAAWKGEFMTRVAEVGAQGWASNIAASPRVRLG